MERLRDFKNLLMKIYNLIFHQVRKKILLSEQTIKKSGAETFYTEFDQGHI